jgi:hypothetical protein
MVERHPVKMKVVGSSPTGGANKMKRPAEGLFFVEINNYLIIKAYNGY